jgi:filamentous hemagglutinin family protein
MTELPSIRASHLVRNRAAAMRHCSALALALGIAAMPAAAAAQSFNGTGTPVMGTATIADVAGTTTIKVDQPETVIDWSVTTAGSTVPFNFQAAGTTAFFQESDSFGSNTQFTVLNRILPSNAAGVPVSRPVEFNGTVEATVFGQRANANVWFYSPTGIVAGPSAVFNVGSLLLTTNDIDTTGGLFGASGEIRLRGPANSTGYIDVRAGAQLNALDPNGSYLALVAPRVVQAGTLQSQTGIALVGAEQADITINAGLMNIVVTEGTTDANGIVHSGTSGGPASTGLADVKSIQMIAIPKNAAMTMLLAGSIGYTPAVSASDDGGGIVLSAGIIPPNPPSTPTQGQGYISIDNATFTSKLTASANHSIDITPTTGDVRFQANATLTAGVSLSAIADAGEQIIGNRDLTFNAFLPGQGGTIDVRAFGTAGPPPLRGEINVGGSFSLEASGIGRTVGQDGVGGSITLEAGGGRIIATDSFMNANGDGASGDVVAGIAGGNGTGGTITVSGSAGGTISSELFFLRTSGFGGNNGGSGRGGTISLGETGASLALGTVSLEAYGSGGFASTQGGDGFGGNITIDITGQSQTWGSLGAGASADPGFASPAGSVGNATGGVNGILLRIADSGSLFIDGNTTLFADARTANLGSTSATAGKVSVLAENGGTFTTAGELNLYAEAFFDGEFFYSNPASTPTMKGGIITVTASGGGIFAGDLLVSANADGELGLTTSGTATGGDVTIGAVADGLITVNANTLLSTTIRADASGANGAVPADAFGGTVSLYADSGSISFLNQTEISASAANGNATGGTASVEIRSGGGNLGFPNLTVTTKGTGGSPFSGNGGTGNGGLAVVDISAGAFTVDTQLTVDASGEGGAGSASNTLFTFTSGNGIGGIARYTQSGGDNSAFRLKLNATGIGGSNGVLALDPETPSIGGTGVGGTAAFTISGGTLFSDVMEIDASALGGNGMDNNSTMVGSLGGDGGDAFGGFALMTMPAGSTGFLTGAVGNDLDGSVIIRANATGGAGGSGNSTDPGNGGNALAGLAEINLADGSFAIKATTVSAIGRGAQGAIGGNGRGGAVQFTVNDTLVGSVTPRTVVSLDLIADGIAGTSLVGAAASSTAGSTILKVDVGASGAQQVQIKQDFTAQANGLIAPAGTGFSANVTGDTLLVSGNTVINTVRDVALSASPSTPFFTSGTLTIDTPRTVTMTSGQMTSGGNASIIAALGIDMTGLASGGTTLLRALSGTVRVSSSLASTGLVTVRGQLVDLRSFGALSFATADATVTDLSIRTGGNLDVTSVSAKDNLTLVSANSGLGGNLHATGSVTGSTITLGGLGNVLLDGLVQSGGTLNVDARGSFTSTPGNLSASGNVAIIADAGITAPTLVSGGTTLLRATGGAVNVATDLISPGLVTVLGQSVDVTSAGNLSFADADATAGALVVSARNLSFNTADATGALTLTAANGAVITNGAVNGGDVSLSALGFVFLGGDLFASGTFTVNISGQFVAPVTITTGGDTSITAPQGISFNQLDSGGTTQLISTTADVVASTSLTSAGLVNARARNVDITSLGALAFADLDATAGNISVQTVGNLDLTTVDATGTVALGSSNGSIRATGAVNANGIAFNALVGDVQNDAAVVSGAGLQVQAGGFYIANGPVSATGTASLDADQGIIAGSVTSGSTTLLRSTGGAIGVTGLTSPGLVTVLGQSVNLVSPGALAFADADATAGDLFVTAAGNLDLTTADATSILSLQSSGGTLNATGALSGGSVLLSGATGLGTAGVQSTGGLFATSGGSYAASGPLSADGLLFISTFTTFTAGGALSAGSDLLVRARGDVSAGTITATSGSAMVSSRANLVAGAITAGNDVNVSALGSTLSVGAVSAGDDIFLTATGINAALTASNLVSSGLGNDLAAGSPVTGIPVGPAGNVTLAHAGGALTVGTVATPGRAILVSDSSTINAGASNTGTALIALARGDVALGAVTTSGLFYVADSAMFAPNLVPAYDPAALTGIAPVRTSGALALAAPISAASVSVTVQGDVTSSSALTSANLLIDSASTVTFSGIAAGGSSSISGALGVGIGTLSSGGTTLLRATGGAVNVTTDLTSAGLVTVLGRSAQLVSSGPLAFADADATAGALSVQAGGNLTLATADATGALTLTTSAGSLRTTGIVNGNDIIFTAPTLIQTDAAINAGGTFAAQTNGTFTSAGLITTGGNTRIIAPQGISINRLTSGGTTLLQALNGTLLVSTNLLSTGLVTAQARSIDITSLGTLAFADVDATAGDLRIITAGNLDLVTIDATGAVTLGSTAGRVRTTGTVSGNGVTFTAAGDVATAAIVSTAGLDITAGGVFATTGALNATGPVSIAADGGIGAGLVVSGGTTRLAASGGPVAVTELVSTGPVSAAGTSVLVISSGGLSFSDLKATAGNLTVQTGGNLSVNIADATGAMTLNTSAGSLITTGIVSGANVAFSAPTLIRADANINAGGTFTAQTNGTFTAGGLITTGGNTSIIAPQGITINRLTSGGTTLLQALNGTLLVSSSLLSSGLVTAQGRSVDITSTGTLAFADVDATAGDLRIITAGNLDFATIDGTGAVTLGSTAGNVHTTGAVSGNGISLTAAGNVLTDAGLTSLAGVQVSAGGSYTAGGTLSAAGNVSLDAAGGVTAPNVVSGGTTLLRATGGVVNVATNLTSSGLVTALARNINIRSAGALSFADADATAGNMTIRAAGNLNLTTADATGSVILISDTGSLRTTGAITTASAVLNAATAIRVEGGLASTGGLQATTAGTFLSTGLMTADGNARIRADQGVTVDRLTVGGTTLLQALNGTVLVSGDLRSTGLVTALGREVNLTSAGALAFADADATAGNFSVSAAGNLDFVTVDATGSVLLTSTGGAIRTTGAINGNFVSLNASGAVNTAAAVTSGSQIRINSTNGSYTAGGSLSAPGDLILTTDGGITAGTVQSGGQTRLDAYNGAVLVTDLTSSGPVSTFAPVSIDITSPGGLTIAYGEARNGTLTVRAGGNLVLDGLTNALRSSFSTSAGSLITNGETYSFGTSLSAPDFITVNASIYGGLSAQTGGAFIATAPLLPTLGNTSIIAPLGITIGSLQSGGTTLLQALNGTLTISGSLLSSGPVTAQARSIDITSTGELSFADIDASAGNLRLISFDNLDLGTVDVSGQLQISSRAGNVRLNGAAQGGLINISGVGSVTSAAPITSASSISLDMLGAVSVAGTITAGSDIVIVSEVEINVGDVRSLASIPSSGPEANLILLASAGSLSTGTIQTPGRLIAIADTGPVTMGTIDAAQSIDIITSGDVDLNGVTSAGRFLIGYDSSLFPLITAGIFDTTLLSGAVPQRTSGLLSVAGPIDAGSITAVIDGPVSGTGITSAGNLLIDTTGDLSFASISSTTGNLSLIGAQGVDVDSVQSGGTTLLRATGGAISVASLTSPGLVTVSGQSAAITSPGALAFADADATAGDLVITAVGNLDFTTVDATGVLRLGSALGVSALRTTGAVNGGDVILLAGSTLQTDAEVRAGGSLFAQSIGDMTIGADWQAGTSLFATTLGALKVTAGAIRSDGSLVLNSQRELMTGRLVAGTSLQIDSRRFVTTGAATAGDWLEITAAGNITTGNLSAGTDLGVATQGNRLAVGDVAAGDDIFLSAFASNLTTLVTAGNVVSSGAGSDTAITLPSIFGDASPTGNVTRIRSGGALAIGNVATPGRAIFVADSGTITTGTASGGEAVLAFARRDVSLGAVTTSGKFYVADSAMFLPNLPSAYDPASLNGLVPVRTAGGLSLSGAVNAGEISVTVLNAATGRTMTAASSLLIDTGAAVTLDGLASGSDGAQILAPQGIDILSLQSGGTTTLQASNGNIWIGNLLSSGLVSALAGSISIRSDGALRFADSSASQGAFFVQADGDLDFAAISAQDAAEISSRTGSIRIAGPVSAANIALSADIGDVRANGALTANFDDTPGALEVLAGGTFSLGGRASAATIDVLSGDIAIGPTAQLGVRGVTQNITLANLNSGRAMFIGGAPRTGAYSLDGAEAQRLFADRQISFVVPTFNFVTGAGDISIGDLALSFGAQGNIGSGGRLKVDTAGNIAVTGAVRLTTAGAQDTFSIDPRRIDIIADTGSIVMRGSNGALSGKLELIADTVRVATSSTLSAIDAATSLPAITALLDQPATPASDGGYIQASAIYVSVVDAFYVQNSGTTIAFPSRRGFSANSLSISTESKETFIAINGQLFNETGLAVTGLQTARDILVNGLEASTPLGIFNSLSSINGCAIGRNCQSNAETTPSKDDNEGKVEPDETPPQVLALIAIEEFQTENLMPMVDEPVTGVGNDDLWQAGCSRDSEGC